MERVEMKPGIFKNRAAAFVKGEDGNMTIESVVWFPIFAILLAFIMNISMVFFTESQMLRVVQDGNRAFSLGRLDSAAEVEEYILAELEYTGANITVTSAVAGGLIETDLTVPASDLMPLNFMTSAFSGIEIGVNAQHIIEF